MLGRQGIPRVAEVLGAPKAVTEDCLEVGQEGKLIRTGRRGGGKGGVHLWPSEWFNLALIHTFGSKRTARELVPAYRALRPVPLDQWFSIPRLAGEMKQLRGCCFGPISREIDKFRDSVDCLPKEQVGGQWSGKGDPRCYRVQPGESLGESFDLLIDYLSYPFADELKKELLNEETWKLRVWSYPYATVSYGDREMEAHFHTFYSDGGDFSTSLTPPGMTRITEFSFSVFKVLADLWADSRVHLGIDSFPSFPRAAPGSAAPEDESAENPSRERGASTHSTDRHTDEGAGAPTRQDVQGLSNPERNACVHKSAITSSRGGRSPPPPIRRKPPPATKEAQYGHAHQPSLL